MADKTNRLSINAPGRFYVDDSCIDCDMCREHAPLFFTRSDDTGSTYVVRQPVTEEEIRLANESMAECPTESIGNDG